VLPFSVSADWNLEINPVNLEDDGVFQCQISHVPLVSRKAHVTVWVPPADPRIVEGPFIQVNLGTEIKSFTINGHIFCWTYSKKCHSFLNN
jgi:hypothetical protein